MNIRDIENITQKILQSRKYQSLGIPKLTVENLIFQEMDRFKNKRDVIKAVRTKLHNIVAPYLEDIDYPHYSVRLEHVFEDSNANSLIQFCQEILSLHESTKERLGIIHQFYDYIFDKLPNNPIILDLACGLNPFSIPIINLSTTTQFHAYDIIQPRIDLINQLFLSIGMQQQAEVRDIIVQPPAIHADAAFLFKEAHRLEKRGQGLTRTLIHAIQTDMFFLSLPNHSINDRYPIRDRMHNLVNTIVQDQMWDVEAKDFKSETIFLIRK